MQPQQQQQQQQQMLPPGLQQPPGIRQQQQFMSPVEAAKAAAAAVASRLNGGASSVAQPQQNPSGKRRFSETATGPYMEDSLASSGATISIKSISRPTACAGTSFSQHCIDCTASSQRMRGDLDRNNAGCGVVPVPDISMYGDVIKHRDQRDTLDDARNGTIEGGTWEHRVRYVVPLQPYTLQAWRSASRKRNRNSPHSSFSKSALSSPASQPVKCGGSSDGPTVCLPSPLAWPLICGGAAAACATQGERNGGHSTESSRNHQNEPWEAPHRRLPPQRKIGGISGQVQICGLS